MRSRGYTVCVPDQAIVAYYTAVAGTMLPFLRGRRVAVRHLFDHTPVFRRHASNRRWITIEDREALLEIVRQHGYEFFPHLEGKQDFWFALDIDIREIPLKLGVIAVQTALHILEERHVRYLLTFSGSNGFHIRWAFARVDVPKKKWEFLRAIVRSLREETERRLQTSPHRAAFYRHIPASDPITELNAMDKVAQHSILFDELILKPQATIRAPFSLHMKHPTSPSGLPTSLFELRGTSRGAGRWVAIPLDADRLKTFSPARDATMTKAKALPSVRLPVNSAAMFLKSPWR